MPINAMNTGADYAFQYFSGQTGVLVNLTDVQDVRIMANKHDVVTRPYNGSPRFGYVPDGLKIDLTITRSLSVLEDLMVTYDQAFSQGQVLLPGFFNQTTNNADGTISRYQYTNAVFWVPNQGNVSRDRVVVLNVELWASQKTQIA